MENLSRDDSNQPRSALQSSSNAEGEESKDSDYFNISKEDSKSR
jgi:hypothetical protein